MAEIAKFVVEHMDEFAGTGVEIPVTGNADKAQSSSPAGGTTDVYAGDVNPVIPPEAAQSSANAADSTTTAQSAAGLEADVQLTEDEKQAIDAVYVLKKPELDAMMAELGLTAPFGATNKVKADMIKDKLIANIKANGGK
jgi:hypothetical protein